MDGVIAITQSPPLERYFAVRTESAGFDAQTVGVSLSRRDDAEDDGGVRVAFSRESLLAASKPDKTPGQDDELTDEEQKQVADLKRRDREVRQHEQAHLAAGGRYVRGGASFEYERGPDNRMYANGGEVSIDVGPDRTPEATVRKMQIVRRAALAPAQPSAQDRGVAAAASQAETKARGDMAKARSQTEAASPDTATQPDKPRTAPEKAGPLEAVAARQQSPTGIAVPDTYAQNTRDYGPIETRRLDAFA